MFEMYFRAWHCTQCNPRSGKHIGQRGPKSGGTSSVTVAYLCLSVGADDLQVPGRHEEGVLLLGCGLVQQGREEHPQVQFQGPWSPVLHTAKGRAKRGRCFFVRFFLGGGQNNETEKRFLHRRIQ